LIVASQSSATNQQLETVLLAATVYYIELVCTMCSASESGLPAKLPLHTDAAAKAELFRERYTILHQVIMSFG